MAKLSDPENGVKSAAFSQLTIPGHRLPEDPSRGPLGGIEDDEPPKKWRFVTHPFLAIGDGMGMADSVFHMSCTAVSIRGLEPRAATSATSLGPAFWQATYPTSGPNRSGKKQATSNSVVAAWLQHAAAVVTALITDCMVNCLL